MGGVGVGMSAHYAAAIGGIKRSGLAQKGRGLCAGYSGGPMAWLSPSPMAPPIVHPSNGVNHCWVGIYRNCVLSESFDF